MFSANHSTRSRNNVVQDMSAVVVLPALHQSAQQANVVVVTPMESPVVLRTPFTSMVTVSSVNTHGKSLF